MRTIPSPNYFPPSEHDIKDAAKAAGLRKYSTDFVSDIANIASGGKVLKPSEYRNDVEMQAMRKVDRVGTGEYSYTAHKNGRIKNHTAETRNRAVLEQTDTDMGYHGRVSDFLKGIDTVKAPGRTPLGKAISVMRALSGVSGGNPSSKDGETIPIFAGDQAIQQRMLDDINNLLENIHDLTKEEMQMLGLDDDNDYDEDTPDLSTKDLQKADLMKDMMNGKHIWLDVSRKLSVLSRMNVRKRAFLEPDVEGDDIKMRPTTGFDELHKLRAVEWALPSIYRMMRVATLAAPIRERARRIEKQQLLYMIVDCSGSMADNETVAKAGGVVMNRLKSVCSGDAQVYMRFFDETLYTEHKATTPSEARKLMELIDIHNFSGGGTRIAHCARKAADRIEEMMTNSELLVRPELVIITDGEDDVGSLNRKDFGLTTVHAFIVGGQNRELTHFARSTGGSAIDKL